MTSRRPNAARIANPIRKFRAIVAGVDDAESEGMMRAPQDEHLETLFSIGSKQRQHVLAIVSACLIYNSAENCRMELNIKLAADHKVQFPRNFGG